MVLGSAGGMSLSCPEFCAKQQKRGRQSVHEFKKIAKKPDKAKFYETAEMRQQLLELLKAVKPTYGFQVSVGRISLQPQHWSSDSTSL